MQEDGSWPPQFDATRAWASCPRERRGAFGAASWLSTAHSVSGSNWNQI